jgi:hypothetical protein
MGQPIAVWMAWERANTGQHRGLPISQHGSKEPE